MFKYLPIETFDAPVKIMTPGGEEHEFTATFSYLDDKAHAVLLEKSVEECCRTVWKGWSGIEAPDPNDASKSIVLAYSDAQRDLLLGHAYISNAVFGGYARARQGLRAKN